MGRGRFKVLTYWTENKAHRRARAYRILAKMNCNRRRSARITKTGSALVELLTGETRSLARTLFSPDEIKEMFVFARTMRTMTPQRAATNPSGSGYETAGWRRRLCEGWARCSVSPLGDWKALL